MPLSDPGITWLQAAPFEDFIDGYFPLTVSLGHLLERRGYAAAFVVLRFAPMMDIPGLGPDAPAPLRLHPRHAGLIRRMGLCVRYRDGRPVLSGWADWIWNDPARPRDQLPETLRLAEPAFLRGIGFAGGDVETGALGPVRASPEPTGIGLGRSSGGAIWPLSCTGRIRSLPIPPDPAGECLAIQPKGTRPWTGVINDLNALTRQ